MRRNMDSREWYLKTKRPSWAPPSWLFGPVWSVLYILIMVSFGYVFIKGYQGDIAFIILLPFILNILFNILFSPIQWGLRNNLLASIDIYLLFITIIWIMVVIFPYYSWVTYIQIPYLIWVTFAGILQTVITIMNWNRKIS